MNVYRDESSSAPIGSVTTEANGTFTIEKLPAGDKFVVKAAKNKSILGVCGQKADVVVQAGKKTDVGNVELKVPTKAKTRRTPKPKISLRPVQLNPLPLVA